MLISHLENNVVIFRLITAFKACLLLLCINQIIPKLYGARLDELASLDELGSEGETPSSDHKSNEISAPSPIPIPVPEVALPTYDSPGTETPQISDKTKK